MRIDTLPDGVTRRACPGCGGTGTNEHAFEGICRACHGLGTVTVEAATGDLAHLIRCAECGLLSRATDITLVAGCSVCGPCRRVAEARQKFFDDLYAPLGRRAT